MPLSAQVREYAIAHLAPMSKGERLIFRAATAAGKPPGPG